MTESGDSTYQSLWPLPPPHWEDADKLSPPDIPQKNLPIFGRPLHSNYKTQLEEAENFLKERSINIDLSNKINALIKINQLLLVKFLELVRILTKNPSQWASKYEEIETIIFYFHHIINSFRPHQARQTIITILENQINRRKQLLEYYNNCINQSVNVLDPSKNKMDEEN